MIFKAEYQLDEWTVVKLGDRAGKYIADELAREIAKLLAGKFLITVPKVRTSKEEIAFHPKRLDMRTEFVFMPIEHWEHVKRMLNILRTSAPTSDHIVREIIDEIENK